MQAELRGLSRFRGTSHEECGLIVHRRGKLRVVKVKNSAKNRRENYRITRLIIAIAKAKLGPGEQIVGFLHTHLPHHPAYPSSHDLLGAAGNPKALHVVYKPSTGEITWYEA
ncbi:Mov34/MPN/PAD-1 family protein [Streptomyces sp. NPDC006477]|uniref:Mov34/MPN/PAD-1 family protein n=1 Tax=Streptomyces sp. NPDC006477 TaxID=3364747 RepID=UPI0036B21CBB